MNSNDNPAVLRRPVRRILWVVVGLTGATMACLIAIYATIQIKASKALAPVRIRVEESLAALRADRVHRPVLFEPAEDGNSWELLTLGLMPLEGLTGTELMSFSSFRNDGDAVPSQDEILRMVAKVEPHLEVLRRALRRRWVEPEYAYEEHFHMQMPLPAKAIQACRIVCDFAEMRLKEGRPDEAVDSLILGLGIADRIAVKGGLVTELVRIAGNGLVMNRLRRLLSSVGLKSEGLARLENTLAELDQSRPDLLQAYVLNDLVWAIGVLDLADGADPEKFQPGLRTVSALYFFSMRRMAAEYFAIHAAL